MAFYYHDAPELSDETFFSTIQASEKPPVVLFWDDTVEVDNAESLAIGLRWLHDGSESRRFYNFFKACKSACPNSWKEFAVSQSQTCLMSGTVVLESKIGFHYASEINSWLMDKIDKKAPQE